jgi:hypothetical protein
LDRVLTEGTEDAGSSPSAGAGQRRSSPGRGRTQKASRTIAFLLSAAVILVYGLRGGSYDLVIYETNGLVIWWVLSIGVALGLLPRFRPAPATLMFLGALAAYAGWIALSLLWTDSSERTTLELARTLDYLGLVALFAFALDRGTWRSALAGLGFGALLVCVVALGSRLAPGTFGTDAIDLTYHIDRLSVPFGYWNSVAALGAMCIALGITWSAHDTMRIRRALSLALVPVAGTVVYLTYSRAGVGGAALAVIAAIVLSRNRITAILHTLIAAIGIALGILAVRGETQIAHSTGTRGAGAVLGAVLLAAALCAGVAVLTSIRGTDSVRLPAATEKTIGIIALAAVIVAAVALGPRAWDSFTRTPTVTGSDPTARLASLSSSRYPVWKTAIKAFRSHPLEGTGAGTFQFWWNEHATDAEPLRQAHNIWLQNLAELGLPGLLLIVAVFASALRLAIVVRRRARRSTSAGAASALLAALIVYLLHASVDWMWESTAVTVIALAGVGIAAARLGERPLRLRLPGRALMALACAGAGILQLPGMFSTRAIEHSQSAAQAGNQALALAWARDAVRAEPWSASAYQQRGLVLESIGHLGEAAGDLNAAISREPQNYQHWLVLARIETERGRLSAAVRDYNRAHELGPRESVFASLPVRRSVGTASAGRARSRTHKRR